MLQNFFTALVPHGLSNSYSTQNVAPIYLTFTTGEKYDKQPDILTLRLYMCNENSQQNYAKWLYKVIFVACWVLNKPLNGTHVHLFWLKLNNYV